MTEIISIRHFYEGMFLYQSTDNDIHLQLKHLFWIDYITSISSESEQQLQTDRLLYSISTEVYD